MKNKTLRYSPLILLLVGIVTGITLATCVPIKNGLGTGFFTDVPRKELLFPKADYDSIIRVGQDLLAVTSGENVDNLLLYANEGDQSLHPITFPEDAGCSIQTAYLIFDTFPDGRVQLWKSCVTEPKTLQYLLAYDWHTRATEQIAGPLAPGSSRANWNPDGTRAIVYQSSGFSSGTLSWLWRGKPSPLDLIIGDDGHSWNLKDDFPDFQDGHTSDIGKTGNTGQAAWSPDGHTIAFFASAEAIGKTGSDRFYVKYKLYLMDAGKLQPHPVLDDIHFPYVLAWSPDSTQVAFEGKYGSMQEEGLWLYSSTSNSIIGIAKGRFRSLLWTKDGKNLITIRCNEGGDDCSQIEEYDLTGVLTP
jgi:hypothetical protein